MLMATTSSAVCARLASAGISASETVMNAPERIRAKMVALVLTARMNLCVGVGQVSSAQCASSMWTTA